MLVVGDDPAELEAGARARGCEADVCVLSGGLGPTHDDRTVETLARVAGRELVVDEDAGRARSRAVSRGGRRAPRRARTPTSRRASASRRRSRTGGRSLGLAGTAPAVLLEHDGRRGRRAARAPQRAAPALAARPRVRGAAAASSRAWSAEHRRVLRFFGPSESAVARVLEEAGGEGDGLEVTSARTTSRSGSTCSRAARGGGARPTRLGRGSCEERFADDLFAEDERTVGELVLDRCRRARAHARDRRVLHRRAGRRAADRRARLERRLPRRRRRVLERGEDAAPRACPPEVLERHGAVSAEAAEAMAEGARTALGADVAAGRDGRRRAGRRDAPRSRSGSSIIHAVAPAGSSQRRVVLPGDREAVRARATALALHVLRRLLSPSVTDTRADLPRSVEGHERLRLFVALPLPDEIVGRLSAWQRAELDGAPGRTLVPPGNLHVTLAFLGSRPATDVERHPRRPARARRPRRSGRCLRRVALPRDPERRDGRLDDEGERATELAGRVGEGLEGLGRLRARATSVASARDRSALPAASPARRRPLPDLGRFSPSEVALYHSVLRPTGAQYEVLESVPLGG